MLKPIPILDSTIDIIDSIDASIKLKVKTTKSDFYSFLLAICLVLFRIVATVVLFSILFLIAMIISYAAVFYAHIFWPIFMGALILLISYLIWKSNRINKKDKKVGY